MNKLEPDFNLLKKYLPMVRANMFTWYKDYLKKKNNDFDTEFTRILENNLLIEHKDELLYFAGWYAITFDQTNYDIKNHNKPNPFEQHNKDLKELQAFILGKKCNEIKFSSPINTVKIKNEYLISGLMNLIQKYINLKKDYPVPPATYVEYVNEMNEIINRNPLTSMPEIPIMTEEEFNNNPFPKKQSHYKNFAIQLLNGLFPYLKSETHFKSESNNRVFNFIIELTTFINVEWKNISVYPNDYLKDLYKNL